MYHFDPKRKQRIHFSFLSSCFNLGIKLSFYYFTTLLFNFCILLLFIVVFVHDYAFYFFNCTALCLSKVVLKVNFDLTWRHFFWLLFTFLFQESSSFSQCVTVKDGQTDSASASFKYTVAKPWVESLPAKLRPMEFQRRQSIVWATRKSPMMADIPVKARGGTSVKDDRGDSSPW